MYWSWYYAIPPYSSSFSHDTTHLNGIIYREMSKIHYLPIKALTVHMNWVSSFFFLSLILLFPLILGGPYKWLNVNYQPIIAGLFRIHSLPNTKAKTLMLKISMLDVKKMPEATCESLDLESCAVISHWDLLLKKFSYRQLL